MATTSSVDANHLLLHALKTDGQENDTGSVDLSEQGGSGNNSTLLSECETELSDDDRAFQNRPSDEHDAHLNRYDATSWRPLSTSSERNDRPVGAHQHSHVRGESISGNYARVLRLKADMHAGTANTLVARHPPPAAQPWLAHHSQHSQQHSNQFNTPGHGIDKPRLRDLSVFDAVVDGMRERGQLAEFDEEEIELFHEPASPQVSLSVDHEQSKQTSANPPISVHPGTGALSTRRPSVERHTGPQHRDVLSRSAWKEHKSLSSQPEKLPKHFVDAAFTKHLQSHSLSSENGHQFSASPALGSRYGRSPQTQSAFVEQVQLSKAASPDRRQLDAGFTKSLSDPTPSSGRSASAGDRSLSPERVQDRQALRRRSSSALASLAGSSVTSSRRASDIADDGIRGMRHLQQLALQHNQPHAASLRPKAPLYSESYRRRRLSHPVGREAANMSDALFNRASPAATDERARNSLTMKSNPEPNISALPIEANASAQRRSSAGLHQHQTDAPDTPNYNAMARKQRALLARERFLAASSGAFPNAGGLSVAAQDTLLAPAQLRGNASPIKADTSLLSVNAEHMASPADMLPAGSQTNLRRLSTASMFSDDEGFAGVAVGGGGAVPPVVSASVDEVQSDSADTSFQPIIAVDSSDQRRVKKKKTRSFFGRLLRSNKRSSIDTAQQPQAREAAAKAEQRHRRHSSASYESSALIQARSDGLATDFSNSDAQQLGWDDSPLGLQSDARDSLIHGNVAASTFQEAHKPPASPPEDTAPQPCHDTSNGVSPRSDSEPRLEASFDSPSPAAVPDTVDPRVKALAAEYLKPRKVPKTKQQSSKEPSNDEADFPSNFQEFAPLLVKDIQQLLVVVENRMAVLVHQLKQHPLENGATDVDEQSVSTRISILRKLTTLQHKRQQLTSLLQKSNTAVEGSVTVPASDRNHSPSSSPAATRVRHHRRPRGDLASSGGGHSKALPTQSQHTAALPKSKRLLLSDGVANSDSELSDEASPRNRGSSITAQRRSSSPLCANVVTASAKLRASVDQKNAAPEKKPSLRSSADAIDRQGSFVPGTNGSNPTIYKSLLQASASLGDVNGSAEDMAGDDSDDGRRVKTAPASRAGSTRRRHRPRRNAMRRKFQDKATMAITIMQSVMQLNEFDGSDSGTDRSRRQSQADFDSNEEGEDIGTQHCHDEPELVGSQCSSSAAREVETSSGGRREGSLGHVQSEPRLSQHSHAALTKDRRASNDSQYSQSSTGSDGSAREGDDRAADIAGEAAVDDIQGSTHRAFFSHKLDSGLCFESGDVDALLANVPDHANASESSEDMSAWAAGSADADVSLPSTGTAV